MQLAILAGGRGSRLGALGRPKVLARIGGRSVLWHVLGRYFDQGFEDAVVALGYRADLALAELPGDFPEAIWERTGNGAEARFAGRPNRRLRLIDTGAATATAGRLLRLRPHLDDAPFFLNWTDVLSDLDYRAVRHAHAPGDALTMVAARPPARFGRMEIGAHDRLAGFAEKDRNAEGWVNAGTCVVAPRFFDFCAGADESFETGPVARAVAAGAVGAWRHPGFWQCMDFPHEHRRLDELWHAGDAPWRRAAGRRRRAAG